jgi:hypothetical protein
MLKVLVLWLALVCPEVFSKMETEEEEVGRNQI